jgi:hypothetical protein
MSTNEIYDSVERFNADMADKYSDEAEILIDAYSCALVSLLRGASANHAPTLQKNGDFLLSQLKERIDHQVAEAEGATKH